MSGIVTRWLNASTRLQEYFNTFGILSTYKLMKRYSKNAVQLPWPYFELNPDTEAPLADLDWPTYRDLYLQYIGERYAIDPDLHILIVANTFYGQSPNFGGSSQKRLTRTNELLDLIQLQFPRASIYFSCDKMTKTGTGRSPLTSRDPTYFNAALLQRPTTVAWPNSSWHWDNQWLGNNNVYDDDNPQGRANFRIHPAFDNDSQARTKFYVNVIVPPEHMNKWTEIRFKVQYSSPSRRWAITDFVPYAVIPDHPELNETIPVVWGYKGFVDPAAVSTNGNRRTGVTPTNVKTGYSRWDNISDIDYIVLRFPTRYERYTIRIDYSWDGGVSHLAPGVDRWSQGYVYIKDFELGDSFILDDVITGGVPTENFNKFVSGSLDGTAIASTMYTVDPNNWVQLYTFNNYWPAPFHRVETQNHTKNSINQIMTYFGSRPQLRGFFFECDELYYSGWDPDLPVDWSCAKGFAYHYAEISKYIYSINPNLKAYAYGDLCNPGHGGKTYYRGNNPQNNGMKNILTYYKAFGGKNNVIWIDWGGLSPALFQQTITYLDSMKLPWGLGYCRDQSQWSQEGLAGWAQTIAYMQQNVTSYCVGGMEFGFHKFYEVRNEPMHQTTLNNLTTLAGFQKADTNKRLTQKLVILPYNP